MKKNNILYSIVLLAFASISLASCDSYLDKMPDNRAEVDSEDKIASLTTSAYPTNDYILLNECMSDNVDDMGPTYANYTSRFLDQVYSWNDATDEDNESSENLWQSCYKAIASANQALKSIEELGGATTTKLKETKAEALLCRAYSHFILTNEFCMNYNSKTSTKDMGVSYLTEPETTLDPKYERGTVAHDYEMIDKDIQEALPIVGDTHYDVPKYHFNSQAAYAFAARFYLFYEKWDKAAEYASVCLGASPKTMLQNWDKMQSYGVTNSLTPRCNLYIDASSNSNFLLLTSISEAGLFGSNHIYFTKYSHNTYLASTEDLLATNIYGDSRDMRCKPMTFSGSGMDRVIVAKLPYMFEETNPVAKTGYSRTVYPAFKADLTLLERAEAYIMLKEYTKACDDLNAWMHNYTNSDVVLTPQNIQAYYTALNYANWNAPTIKKHLYPAFGIDKEGSIQECMLQCALSFKRIETSYEGLRWFDIKRYGINIVRRTINASGKPGEKTDSLTTNDLRRAIQIPFKVRQAGLQANPR